MIDSLKMGIGKFTRYDWFTTLIPGIMCIALGRHIGIFDMSNALWIEDFGIIFFLGLVSSRIGASIVEPIFRIKRFGLWSNYDDYMKLRLYDAKSADMLTTNANWFRSIVGMCILLVVIYLLDFIWIKAGFTQGGKRWVELGGTLLLFGDAYRRQLCFIKEQINCWKKKLNNDSVDAQ